MIRRPIRNGLFLLLVLLSPTGWPAPPRLLHVGIHKEYATTCENLFLALLKTTASQEGWDLRIESGDIGQLHRKLHTGSLDVVAAAPYAKDLERAVHFTSETVLSTWGQLYTMPEDTLASLPELTDSVVGVMKGDPYGAELRKLLENMSLTCTVVEFNSYPETFEALQSDWIQAALVDRLFALSSDAAQAFQATSIILAPVELRFATAKTDGGQLAATIDYHLRTMKNDPGSLYHRLISAQFNAQEESESLRHLKQALLIGLALLLLSAGASLLLRHRVRVKTAELSQKNEALKKAIESRRRTQAALKKSEEAYRTFLQNFQGIAFSGKADFIPKFLHGAVAPITGYSEKELLTANTSWRNLVHTDDLALFDQHADDLASTPDHKADFQCRLVDKSGSTRWMHYLLRNVPGQDGAPNLIQGSIYDITDDVMREEQLRQAQKMEAVGQLAGGVAHDFNNILMVIQGCTEFAKENLPENSDLMEDLDLVLCSTKRGTDLARQLLTFSSRQLVSPRQLDLNETIGGIQKMLWRLIGEDINMTFEPERALWPIQADPGQIEQVLMNLAVNARDAMEQGGKLTLRTQNIQLTANDPGLLCADNKLSPGRYVVLSVADTGVGMDDQTVARIFEPFFTTKGVGKGTGLGLATVYGIVHKHQGCICVDSHPGNGTTFQVYLPAAKGAECAAGTDQRSQCLRGGGETILLVEDELLVRNVMTRLLRQLGYRVRAAESGEEALEIASRHGDDIDVLLTDVILPGMDGKQLANTLALQWPDLKVIFCSGYTDYRIIQRQLDSADTVFLQKPVSKETLAATVREVIELQPEAVMA